MSNQDNALADFWGALDVDQRHDFEGYTAAVFSDEENIHHALIRQGQRCEEAAAKYPGKYEGWVRHVLGWSTDTAWNRRNYARHFAEVSDETALKFHQGAAFQLAAPGVSDEARAWALDHATDLQPGQRFDVHLAHIARDPYVRARYAAGELTKPQGAKLANALTGLKMPQLYEWFVKQRVSYGEIVTYLTEAYYAAKTRSTWNDFKGDQFQFRFVTNGHEYLTPIEDMTPEMLVLYREWRHFQHIEAGRAKKAGARADQFEEFTFIPNADAYSRDGQRLTVTIPPDIPETATIEIEVKISYERNTSETDESEG